MKADRRGPEEDLHEVHLIGLPVELHRRVNEHNDGVMRELTFISMEPGSAPHRVRELANLLDVRYSGVNEAANQLIERATSEGRSAVDLTYRLPIEARGAVMELGRMLDEVDEFCAQGGLLALAAPSELRRYRGWLLGEMVRQLDGAPPTPWTD